ncbi:MAG: flotillin-like FloA family protein, partial [Thermoguttaceae bacterium]|nr:flotillin-like FloA family protein [Thermoguttaceae bacterium]
VVAAVAKDGIEVRAKARVTVRTNIERLVGGAGEETIIARVGEGIVRSQATSFCARSVIQSPSFHSYLLKSATTEAVRGGTSA